MIMASSVQKSSLVLPKPSLQGPYLITQYVTTPTKDHWPRLMRMRSNGFSGLQLVRLLHPHSLAS